MQRFQQLNDFLEESSFFYTIAIGMDSTYSYVSKNYNRHFDQSNGSLLGKHFSVTLHPDDVKICAEVGGKCIENPGELYPATLRKHDGNGGFVVTQWEMKAFFETDGTPLGIYCIGYNITEYMDARTRLTNAALEIAEKNDQLSEIGFMQSHVVRKPLANIMGLTAILGTLDMDTNQKSITDMLVKSARELDSVVRAITNKIS